jgi:hypothetical protein
MAQSRLVLFLVSRRRCVITCWILFNEWHFDPELFVLLDFVTDRSDRNPESFSRLRTASAAETERFENKPALNLRDRTADKFWNFGF